MFCNLLPDLRQFSSSYRNKFCCMKDTDALRILKKTTVHVTCLLILFTSAAIAAFCKYEEVIPPPQSFPYKFCA